MQQAVRRLIPAIAVMLSLAAAGARAGQLPLREVGAGAAALSFPDYRGSNKRQSWLLPIPYIIYRGEFLQADERRTRGLFYHTDRLEIDVGINGSVPVDSGKNAARRGLVQSGVSGVVAGCKGRGGVACDFHRNSPVLAAAIPGRASSGPGRAGAKRPRRAKAKTTIKIDRRMYASARSAFACTRIIGATPRKAPGRAGSIVRAGCASL
jgi:outer membrane scaffolding protein for murein synthesis (MipA/OmpV family)